MKEYDAARRKTWKGYAAMVRDALADGPMDIEELMAATGLEELTIKHACTQMATTSGGVMRSPDDPGKWELFRMVLPKRDIRLRRGCSSGKPAGPITIGRGSKWFVGAM